MRACFGACLLRYALSLQLWGDPVPIFSQWRDVRSVLSTGDYRGLEKARGKMQRLEGFRIMGAYWLEDASQLTKTDLIQLEFILNREKVNNTHFPKYNT